MWDWEDTLSLALATILALGMFVLVGVTTYKAFQIPNTVVWNKNTCIRIDAHQVVVPGEPVVIDTRRGATAYECTNGVIYVR